MTIIWRPDTCDCAIEINAETWKWVATLERCELHVAKGKAHLTEVLAHHRPFNDLSQHTSEKRSTKTELDEELHFGLTPADLDIREKCRAAKEAEVERIRDLKGSGR